MWLLIIFITVPIIEIGLFIQVGGWLGLWETLLIVVMTAIVGANLVKSQGLSILADLQRSISQMSDPISPLAHGAMILLSGALLLTPGFFTDTVGFLLLVPQIRSFLMKHFQSKISVQKPYSMHRQQYQDPTIIDAEYKEIHDPSDPSPWRKD